MPKILVTELFGGKVSLSFSVVNDSSSFSRIFLLFTMIIHRLFIIHPKTLEYHYRIAQFTEGFSIFNTFPTFCVETFTISSSSLMFKNPWKFHPTSNWDNWNQLDYTVECRTIARLRVESHYSHFIIVTGDLTIWTILRTLENCSTLSKIWNQKSITSTLLWSTFPSHGSRAASFTKFS